MERDAVETIIATIKRNPLDPNQMHTKESLKTDTERGGLGKDGKV